MNKPLGKNSITKLMKKAASKLGINEQHFSGGHVWRHVMITKLANDGRVSVTETMKADRYNSVSASAANQSTDIISEGNKLDCLLEEYTKASFKKQKHNLQSSPTESTLSQQLHKESKYDLASTPTESSLLSPDLTNTNVSTYNNNISPFVNNNLEFNSTTASYPVQNTSNQPQNTQEEYNSLKQELKAVKEFYSMKQKLESLEAQKPEPSHSG